MTLDAPRAPQPDDKDWTFVLDEACAECGFDARTVTTAQLPALIGDSVTRFAAALGRPDAAERRSPEVWSTLEYGCHVRDVCQIFDDRIKLMLSEDDPMFANWDQDATAIEQRYWEQDPHLVAEQFAASANRIARLVEAVRPDQWARPGRRSNGSAFTVESISRYFVHDLEHHAHDIEA